MNWERLRDVLLVISWAGLIAWIFWLIFVFGLLVGWWP